jgi:iron complex outermembrane receptor protein
MKHNLFVVLFLLCTIAFAQKTNVTGKVIDAKTSEALIGVNIEVEGSTNGTVTDFEGNYELEVAKGTSVLVFSYVGYDNIVKTISVNEGEKKIVNVSMGEMPMLLDGVVVTGTKFETKLGEQTVSLDVIKPAFIDKQNITKMDDAIKRSPGVTVVDGQPNIRGGSGFSYGAGSRVLVLQDDLPILDAAAGFPSWGSLPVENISQIEVIKGAASALYGSAAMNGIINIRTAYPTSTPVTKVSVYGGVYDNPNENDFDANGNKIKIDKRWWKNDQIILGDTTIDISNQKRPHFYGVQFGHRQKIGKIDLVLGGQIEKSQGFKYPDNSFRMRASGNVRYRINEKVSIGVSGNIQAGRTSNFFLWGGDGVSKYLPGTLTGIPTESRTFKLLIDPYFNYADEKGNKHKILGRFYKSDNNNSNNQSNFVNQYYAEYQYQRRFEKINFTITTGAVAQYAAVDAELYSLPQSKSRNIAGYIQLDKKFWDKVNISAGFRFENNKISETKTETKPVGRFGINYQPAKYTYLRASFGQGYRFPTIAEKFIYTQLSPSIEIRSNPDLTSETGFSAEFGVKQGIKLGKNINAFLDVAGFYSQYNNMMEFNPGAEYDSVTNATIFYFQSLNIGNTRIYGTEVTIFGEGKVANKFPMNIMLGYTFVKPEYRDYDENKAEFQTDLVDYNVLKYRFRHTFTSSWDAQFSRFTIGLSAQYYSFMENLDGIFVSIAPGLGQYRINRLKEDYQDKKKQNQYKGDFILDVRVGVLIGKKKNYSFTFNVKNITNREYTLRPALIEAPRNYSFRWDMTF